MKRNYPIEQQDIDDAIERVRLCNEEKERQQALKRPKIKEPAKVSIQRAKDVLGAMKRLPVLPLAEAIKRLGDDKIYQKAVFRDD